MKYAFIQRREKSAFFRIWEGEGGNIHTAPSEEKNEGSLPSKPRPQPRMNESVKRKEEKRKEKEEGEKEKEIVVGVNGKKQKLQHPDFARGPPPHYYPGQNVLNFADQTGCGALTIVWP